jgi:hypothetical protein
MMTEISLLVSRFQDTAILHDHANPAIEVDLGQQALHGCGQYFRGANFAAKLSETRFLYLPQRVRHTTCFLPSRELFSYIECLIV